MSLFTTDIRHDKEFSLISGETVTVGNLDGIEECIGLILRTARGEMFGDPDFGCNLYTYLYEYDGAILHRLIKEDVAASVNKWESRVHVAPEEVETSSRPNERTIDVTVNYHLRNTDYIGTYSFLINRSDRL
jgi:phage baseplate assembly protein W